jgi:hypothetical protein
VAAFVARHRIDLGKSRSSDSLSRKRYEDIPGPYPRPAGPLRICLRIELKGLMRVPSLLALVALLGFVIVELVL